MRGLFTFLFVIFDFIVAFVAWGLFYYFRKTVIEHVPFESTKTFWQGTIIVAVLWVIFYTIQGTYIDVRRLYRLRILSYTVFATIFGCIVLFFALLIDDEVESYKDYYQSLLILASIHFVLTIFARLVLTSIVVRRIHTKKDGFRTLLIGGSEKAVSIYNEIQQLSHSSGNLFVGYVNINGVDRLLENELDYLGHVDNLEHILNEYAIEEVIIALESTEHEKLKTIISKINHHHVIIKIAPDLFDILAGSVKLNNIFGALLMEVNEEVMPPWQRFMKRCMDIGFSLMAIIILIPFYLVFAICVKLSSKGPILFFQERVGLNGKVFKIIKFRTMFVDAEKLGPQLSSSNDPRITPIGRFMRKVRIDEFPQFFNVLLGDMSLVGPRPERQYFIDQIVKNEPQIMEVTKVRPGITSWGQVKYGYAENVDQMVQRMKFDLLYLKNRTLALDLKIMLYTILIVVKGKGK